jgi:hypothetical protein
VRDGYGLAFAEAMSNGGLMVGQLGGALPVGAVIDDLQPHR